MNSTRSWIGGMLCVAAGLTLATLNVIPGYDFPRHGSIAGHVTYDGQPVTAGMILFVSNDGDHELLARAPINRRGDYVAFTSWKHDWENGAWFTMWVVPQAVPGIPLDRPVSQDRDRLPNEPVHSSVSHAESGTTSVAISVRSPGRFKGSELLVNLKPSIRHIDVNLTN